MTMDPKEIIASNALANDQKVIDARRKSLLMARSDRWRPLVRQTGNQATTLAECIQWMNDLYCVNVRRYPDGWPLGGGQWASLGISTCDGSPRHDWREFQLIKNEICGPEWEAIELYPAESRLLDPSNYYILWCAPKIPVGMYKPRLVVGVEKCIAPQRGWRPGFEPEGIIK